EQALTRDTVPVNVDAIIFWHVHDARKAALEITNYRQAIDRVAQTSLREMIGSSMLAALLSDRKAADEHLRQEIGNKTAGWGVSVTSVEIPDVDGRQHEPCLGSGACGPKGSWRGVGVAKERRLNNGDPDQPARCHRQH